MENFKHEFETPIMDIIEGNWDKNYKIDENAPFYFKFNDNHKLMKKIKTVIKNNPEAQKFFHFHSADVDELKKLKVWLKQNESVISLTMFDVYTSFMHHLKDNSFEDQLFNSNDISFLGPLGPFKAMPLISILNEELIDKFIFSQLVKNKLPMRSLRVHTSGKVRIEFGEDFNESTDLSVKQVTDSGILFSSKDDLILNSIEKSQFVKFFIDTRSMSEFVANDLVNVSKNDKDFFYTTDTLRYFFIEQNNIVKSLSYKSGIDNEVYFFCRYPHMLESDVPNIFHEFISKVKTYMDNLAS